jgi:RES domain-containing protein
LMVHFSSLKALNQNYSFAVLEVPDKYLVTLPETSLPEDMLRYNHPVLWELTEHYFKEQDVLILRVPSVLVSGEYNYLLNPAHESFKRVRAVSIEPAILDERYKNLLGKT